MRRLTVSPDLLKVCIAGGMSPEELAALHPKLYHVTSPEAWPSIERHGLLPASELLELFGENAARRTELTTRRRPVQVPLHHPLHGIAVLTDNVPLIERSLAACLDDALTPGQWLAMLNARVFFWPDRGGVDRLLGARTNRGRTRQVLVFRTLELVRAHAGRVEISPINSGSTIHKPARRGLTTYTPLLSLGYRDWQLARGRTRPDTIKEVVIRGGLPDIARYLLDSETI